MATRRALKAYEGSCSKDAKACVRQTVRAQPFLVNPLDTTRLRPAHIAEILEIPDCKDLRKMLRGC